jgi:hypothetical protein
MDKLNWDLHDVFVGYESLPFEGAAYTFETGDFSQEITSGHQVFIRTHRGNAEGLSR